MRGRTRRGEAREHARAARHDRRMRPAAIIGLAIPGRKIQDLDLRRGKGQRFLEGPRAAAVARHMDESSGAIFGRAGERAHEIGGDESIESVGHRGQCQRAALGELIDGAVEWGHEILHEILRNDGLVRADDARRVVAAVKSRGAARHPPLVGEGWGGGSRRPDIIKADENSLREECDPPP